MRDPDYLLGNVEFVIKHRKFAHGTADAGRVKELREMATLVQRELLENRRLQLLPLLNQLLEDEPPAGVEPVGLSLTQIVNRSIEEYLMESLGDAIWGDVRSAQSMDEVSHLLIYQSPGMFY